MFTLDTGRHFPETLETLERSEQRYGLRIRAGRARRATRWRRWWPATACSASGTSVEARKACCDVRKVRPLRRALPGAAAWITGLRRGQSAGRARGAVRRVGRRARR